LLPIILLYITSAVDETPLNKSGLLLLPYFPSHFRS